MRFIFLVQIGDSGSLNDNTFVYTLKSAEAINNVSRELYTNLKNKGVTLYTKYLMDPKYFH